MSVVHSLLLGALQGLAEFLPISSSGHLLLARRFLNLAEIPILYDVLLHLSTLLVVISVFRRRIGAILASLGRWIRSRAQPADRENLRLILYIILATAVTAGVGLLLDRFEARLLEQPKALPVLFFVTALILISTLAARGTRDYFQFGFFAALIVGLAQGIGVLPGISRSGITISAAVLCGLHREKAGEFSFLLSIPAVLGALILKLNEAQALWEQVQPLALGVGALASFAFGLGSLLLLLRLVRRGRLAYFSLYLIPLSLVTFFLL